MIFNYFFVNKNYKVKGESFKIIILREKVNDKYLNVFFWKIWFLDFEEYLLIFEVYDSKNFI